MRLTLSRIPPLSSVPANHPYQLLLPLHQRRLSPGAATPSNCHSRAPMVAASSTQGARKSDVALAIYCTLAAARGCAGGAFRYHSKDVAGPWVLMLRLVQFDRTY